MTLRYAPLVLLVVALRLAVPAAQAPAPVQSASPTPGQMEAFLLRATILKSREVSVGTTNTRRATLSDGVLTHDAQIQTIDQMRAKFEVPGQPTEYNFVDSYRYNIAAYRVAVLLGLDNVPMSVERSVDGDRAAVTWWIDDVMMDEGTRVKKQVRSADNERTAMQIHVMRVFDELIANRDRNMGNLLWTSDWKMWMIDHTRAFRRASELAKPDLLERVERSFLERMRTLTREGVAKAAGRNLTRFEIEAMLDRRDRIVKLFDDKVAQRGEAGILYTIRRAP